MNGLSVLLIIYSLVLIGLGWWAGRAVRASSDYFVAGRSLGPGLIFATFLAANIGASSTVGATGHAYRDGLAAWWWNGGAAIGTMVLAFWVGPRMWRIAKDHDLLTVGDFLEYQFGRGVRGFAALSIWLGSFFILCGQLKGAALVLERATGLSQGTGAFLATVATVGYFVMGGLRSAAWVNVVQLVLILGGFAMAGPIAAHAAGGLFVSGTESSFWTGSGVGWQSVLLLAPAFFLSPGLLQKAYGARSADALTKGVAWSGVVLAGFAFLPVLLGMAARQLQPDLAKVEMALPAVLASNVPALVGSLALAAVLSAELSSADAVLFMLATSGARDFYRGILRPNASDTEVLTVARWLAVVGGIAGFGLTFYLDSVVAAIKIFYQLMVVTLFAPILGGIVLPKAGRWGAIASMLVGVATMITVHLATGGVGWGWAEPHFVGLLASSLTYFLLAVF